VSWWNSAVWKSFAASLVCFVCQFCKYTWYLNVEYEFPLRNYNRDASTSLPLEYGQSCFIDCWSSQFGYFWLCKFVQFCDVRFCQQVVAHWAGLMLWWMAKNLMTNDTYDARAAGLLNSAVQIQSPRRRMSTIIPSNRPLAAYIHWSPTSIEYDLQCTLA